MGKSFARAFRIGLAVGFLFVFRTVPAQEPPTEPSSEPLPAPAPESAPVVPVPTPQRQPQVTVLSTTPSGKDSIIVEIEVVTPSGGAVEIQPTLNGKVIRDFSIAQARNLAMGNRYTLTLPRKDGTLSLVARGEGAESAPALVRLRAGALEKRPALYVLSVGVGNYLSSDIPKLRYPAKDASDLAMTLRTQRDLLYREIVLRVLADKEATREAIFNGFSWLQKSVGPSDTAVIFLAGHGTNDPDGSYYYLPVDAQSDRQTMISGTALQDGLRGITGRIVLMLDTCHSGNVLGKKSLNRLINDLTSENRIVVFAASTGDQTARESPAWQNGAFTKAIIEGLRGVADYQEDGHINVSELETWAGVRVSQLTAGAQTPTLAKPNAVPDYVLSALPVSGILPNPKQALRRKVLWGSLGALAGIAIVVGAVVGTLPKAADPNIVYRSF